MKSRRAIVLLVLAVACRRVAHADPWLAPGNEGLRADIQLLADAYVLRGPVTTWPLSWPDVARDVQSASPSALDTATAAALLRVQRLARSAASRGFGGASVRAAATNESGALRGYADTPRDELEIGVGGGWLGDHIALNLQVSAVENPADGKRLRGDGSYVGLNVGNITLSAGLMERWWGPGWDGSLILSTNARPIPSVTLERNYTDAFENRLLSWLGPWRASIAVGEAEEHGVDVPNVHFLAARVNFRPRPWLEFAISRTAQFCGGDRPCGWSQFGNLLIGRDNQVDGSAVSAEQPGNQMAGYDLRLRSPWRKLPMAFYTQWIGEDEAGGLPSKFLGLFGMESWFSTELGGVRVRFEYADTTCIFTRDEPQFGCAYRNSIYPQGYAYRGRIIGDSMDNDGRRQTVAAILSRPSGDVVSVAVRRVELNRDGGGPHAISTIPLDLDNVELRYSRPFSFGQISLGTAFDTDSTDGGSNVRGFVTFAQGF